MKRLLLLLLVGTVAIQAKVIAEDRTWVYDIRAWAESSFHGNYIDFNGYVPYLHSYDFDNTIASVRVKGIWIFYDLPEYNTYGESFVHWSWGLDYKDSFTDGMQNKVSSLRYAGDQVTMNEDGYNLYAGQLFTQKDLYETNDIQDLLEFHQEVNSIIIIGRSSWRFCEEAHYQGKCVCLHPTLSDTNYNDRLDVGFYPKIHIDSGLYRVRSVSKGCY